MLNEIKRIIKPEQIASLDDNQLSNFLTNKIIEYSNDINISLSIEKIKEYTKTLFSDFRGLGILDNFLKDDLVNEIMINSFYEIYIERNGEISKSDVCFENEKEYERLIQKIVSYSGREVNLSNPIADVILQDGSRVNIVIPPITKFSPCVTIRKFPEKTIDIEKLIATKTISKTVSIFLEKVVKSKFNIIIAGGTSSGKTTFLNSLSNFIPSHERVVTIEDSRELKLSNPNQISLQTRNPNNANKGTITIKDLIKTSLRMRPDRIIVGEVRAEEALDMLSGMNTGHDGSLATVHANSVKDVLSRLETMVLRAGSGIPLEAIKRMIASSIEIIIYLKKVDINKRRVIEISEIIEDEFGNSMINRIFEYCYETDDLVRVGDLRNLKLRGLDYEEKTYL